MGLAVDDVFGLAVAFGLAFDDVFGLAFAFGLAVGRGFDCATGFVTSLAVAVRGGCFLIEVTSGWQVELEAAGWTLRRFDFVNDGLDDVDAHVAGPAP